MCRHKGYLSTIAHVWTGEEDLQELGMELRSFLAVSSFTFWISLDPWMDKRNNKNYGIYAIASNENACGILNVYGYVKGTSLEGCLLFSSYMTFRKGSASKTEQCLIAEGLREEWEDLRKQVKPSGRFWVAQVQCYCVILYLSQCISKFIKIYRKKGMTL